MNAPVDLTGFRFGRLIALHRTENKNGRTRWMCVCDCGKEHPVATTTLVSGGTRSCGCLHIEHAMRHVERYTAPIGTKRIHKQSGRMEIKTESGFVFEHVYVMEQKLGRKIEKGYVVHHIDYDKTNNDPANLQLMSKSDHSILHNTGRNPSDGMRKAISKANSKYTMEIANQIRDLVRQGFPLYFAAEKLGVSKMAASRMANNLTYKEIA